MGLWFDFATRRAGTTQTGAVHSDTNGYAFGIRHSARRAWEAKTTLFRQYGQKGAASNLARPSRIQPVPEELRAIGDCRTFAPSPNDRFAIMQIYIFQRKAGRAPGHRVQRTGHRSGVRRKCFFTKYLSSRSRPGLTTRGFVTSKAGKPSFEAGSEFTIGRKSCRRKFKVPAVACVLT